MSLINKLVGNVIELLLAPFEAMHPIVGLAVVSLVTGVVMLVIFKATSSQRRIAEVKRKIHAGFFEIRLFNDDPRAIFKAQAAILRHNLHYLALALVPMIFIMLPLVLVLGQLHFRYGYGGLEPSADTVFTVRLGEEWRDQHSNVERPPVRIDVPEGLQVETPAVWIPSRNEFAWRLRAVNAGTYDVDVSLGEESYAKRVVVSEGIAPRAPVRVRPGFLEELLNPAEEPLPKSAPFESISLRYPDRTIDVFGAGLHWIVVFFVLSIVFAFALRGPFKVEI